MSEISENTRISLFAVLTSMPALFALIFWLSSVDSKATTANDVNTKQEMKIEKQTDLLLEINNRMIRIEELLKHRESK